MPPPLRAETCRKPWNYANVSVNYSSIVIELVDRTRLRFTMEAYIAAFGSEHGGLLYAEFQSIISKNLRRSGVAWGAHMRVYVGIWRVLGASWIHHIASIVRPRPDCPPACKRPLLCIVVDMQLIVYIAGQISLGLPGKITGGFTHMSPGVSVTFLH